MSISRSNISLIDLYNLDNTVKDLIIEFFNDNNVSDDLKKFYKNPEFYNQTLNDRELGWCVPLDYLQRLLDLCERLDASRPIDYNKLIDYQIKKYNLDKPSVWKEDIRSDLVNIFKPLIAHTDFYFNINVSDSSKQILELWKIGVNHRLIGFWRKKSAIEFVLFFDKDVYDNVKNNLLLPNPRKQKEQKKQPHFDLSFYEIAKAIDIVVANINEQESKYKYIPENSIEDFEYVNSVQEDNYSFDGEYVPVPEMISDKTTIISDRYTRNRKNAKIAFSRVSFSCEYNPAHELFTKKSNGEKYLEPHHLIPISQQDNFDYSLDVPANIVSLCSNCHRCIHYGIEGKILLNVLYNQRKGDLEKAGIMISYEDLLKMYNF